MKTLRAKSFPNGEVRFTMFTPVSRVSRESHCEIEQEVICDRDSSPLTLGENSNRHTEKSELAHSIKPGWGETGKCKTFTQNGRRRILRAGGAIDQTISDPSECIFLTGTLPGGTEAAKRAIAEWSSYAMNLVQSWLSKREPEKLLIYCWEFQKRGALHLHLTMVCRNAETRKRIISEWKAQWTRVIDAISLKSEVNCWERHDGHDYSNGKKHVLQTDAQECKASAAAYLSKYLSKSGLQSSAGYNRDYHPARYWGISRPLCALLESMTRELEISISSDSEASAIYQDCLSVAQSGSDCAYNWTARVGTAVAAVAYRKQNYLEELWEPLKNKLMQSSRFCFVNSTIKETLSEFAVTKMMKCVCDLALLLPRRQDGQKMSSTTTSVELVMKDLVSTQKSERIRGLSSGIAYLWSLVGFKECPDWVRSEAREHEKILERMLNHDVAKATEKKRREDSRGITADGSRSGAGLGVGCGDRAVVREAAAVSFYQPCLQLD